MGSRDEDAATHANVTLAATESTSYNGLVSGGYIQGILRCKYMILLHNNLGQSGRKRYTVPHSFYK